MRGYIRKYRFFLIVATSLIVVFVLAESFTASRIAHAQASVTPFTLRLENHAVDGELIDVTTKARRSDGAFVQMGHIFGKVGMLSGDKVRKVELPSGETFIVYDHLRGVTSYTSAIARDHGKKLVALKAPVGCVRPNEQSVGEETIMGQETVAVLWPSLPDSRITEWRALKLNCEPIRVLGEEKLSDGSYKVHNEVSPVSLMVGEPDPALFNVPEDYAELKPSEMMHKEANRLNMTAEQKPKLEKEAQQEDAQYAKYH